MPSYELLKCSCGSVTWNIYADRWVCWGCGRVWLSAPDLPIAEWNAELADDADNHSGDPQ